MLPGGTIILRGNERTCTNEAVFANDSAVLYDGTHAYQYIIADGAGVDNGVMSDGDTAADDAVSVPFHMNGAVFLQIGVIANDYLMAFAADDNARIGNDVFA